MTRSTTAEVTFIAMCIESVDQRRSTVRVNCANSTQLRFLLIAICGKRVLKNLTTRSPSRHRNRLTRSRVNIRRSLLASTSPFPALRSIWNSSMDQSQLEYKMRRRTSKFPPAFQAPLDSCFVVVGHYAFPPLSLSSSQRASSRPPPLCSRTPCPTAVLHPLRNRLRRRPSNTSRRATDCRSMPTRTTTPGSPPSSLRTGSSLRAPSLIASLRIPHSRRATIWCVLSLARFLVRDSHL